MGKSLRAISIYVFLMVITLLVVALPLLYNELDKLADLSANDAMEYTGDLYYASQRYLAQRYATPPTHEALVERRFIEPDSVLLMQWRYTIHWPDSIVAVSTNAMPGGPDKRLLYLIEADEFYGYSLPRHGLPSSFR